MRNLVVLFLFALLLSRASAACTATATCGPFNPLCDLAAILAGAVGCLVGELPSLVLTLENGTLIQNLTQNLASISLSATGTGILQVIVTSNINVLNGISLTGNTLLQVAEGVVMNVTGSITVAKGSLIKVLGNITSQTPAWIYGTLQLAGTVSRTALQTSWFKAPTVHLSGFADGDAILRGNGGIKGDVICGDYVTLSAGNSPGAVFIDGNLIMSSGTNLVIEVESASNFDSYVVSRNITRGNGKATLTFDSGFTPTSRDRIIFASHAAATGFFSSITGNLSPLVMVFGQTSTSTIYDDATVSSYCTSTCTAIELVEQR